MLLRTYLLFIIKLSTVNSYVFFYLLGLNFTKKNKKIKCNEEFFTT